MTIDEILEFVYGNEWDDAQEWLKEEVIKNEDVA